MKRILIACALLCAVVTVSEARPRQAFDSSCNVTMPCVGAPMPYERVSQNSASNDAGKRDKRTSRYDRVEFGSPIVPPETQRSFIQGSTILPHPSGCPARRFCGCGAAVEIFGRPIRSLWLAANWLAFPRAAPAPGMAAARRGHVFVIKQVLGDGQVLAYDANSGGRQTRLHVRSLAGFTVVNPHGGAV